MEQLTPSQLRALKLRLSGLVYREIAGILHVKQDDVKFLLKSAYARLDLNLAPTDNRYDREELIKEQYEKYKKEFHA